LTQTGPMSFIHCKNVSSWGQVYKVLSTPPVSCPVLTNVLCPRGKARWLNLLTTVTLTLSHRRLQQAAQQPSHVFMSMSNVLTHAVTFAIHCRRAVCLPADASGSPQVVPIHLDEIDALSSVRIYIPKDLRQADARALGLKVLPQEHIFFLLLFVFFLLLFLSSLLPLLLQAHVFVTQLIPHALCVSFC